MLHDTVALIAYEQPEVHQLLHYCYPLHDTFRVKRLVDPMCQLAAIVPACPGCDRPVATL